MRRVKDKKWAYGGFLVFLVGFMLGFLAFFNVYPPFLYIGIICVIVGMAMMIAEEPKEHIENPEDKYAK